MEIYKNEGTALISNELSLTLAERIFNNKNSLLKFLRKFLRLFSLK